MIDRNSWLRWMPALVLMALIFLLSSIPGAGVPFFGAWDYAIKKLGHTAGYGLLGVSYYYGFPPSWPRAVRWPLAWLLALGFAFSDEFHQSFVLGRTAALSDVGYDILGATLALIWGGGYSRYRRVRSKAGGPAHEARPQSGPSILDRADPGYADPAEASQADP